MLNWRLSDFPVIRTLHVPWSKVFLGFTGIYLGRILKHSNESHRGSHDARPNQRSFDRGYEVWLFFEPRSRGGGVQSARSFPYKGRLSSPPRLMVQDWPNPRILNKPPRPKSATMVGGGPRITQITQVHTHTHTRTHPTPQAMSDHSRTCTRKQGKKQQATCPCFSRSKSLFWRGFQLTRNRAVNPHHPYVPDSSQFASHDPTGNTHAKHRTQKEGLDWGDSSLYKSSTSPTCN